MAKTIITDRDIEDLAKRGAVDLMLDSDTLLTDLAYEKAGQLGIKLVAARPENGPAAATAKSPYLSQPGADVPKASRNVLHFSPQASEAELRSAIVETGKIAYGSGLMISNDGNISVRMASAFWVEEGMA